MSCNAAYWNFVLDEVADMLSVLSLFVDIILSVDVPVLPYYHLL